MYGYTKRARHARKTVAYRQGSLEGVVDMKDFYKDKKVFVTGYTGFKGTWLCKILSMMGAKTTGYSLSPNTSQNMFDLIEGNNLVEKSIIADIRDLSTLKKAFDICQPDIVFHLAAQPLVLESYKNPHYTYETNVMGTVNILECVRLSDCVKSVLNVTTDKVYENIDTDGYGYVETDKLDGYDPYSNSKSCSELVTHSYIKSFLQEKNVAVSTARAGNVIGGGDFSDDRIIPDCVRAMKKGTDIILRNPNSTRPYQHVLEPLFVYLLIAQKQYENPMYANFYNVGPDDIDCVSTSFLTDLFCKHWGNNSKWIDKSNTNVSHEANFLKLHNGLLKSTFNWQPIWNIETAIEKTVEWSKAYVNNQDFIDITENQIQEFIEQFNFRTEKD